MTLEQLVDRHYAQINGNDFSDAAEIFSADVVTQPPGSPPLTGVEPFVAYGTAFLRAFPDGRIHRDRSVEDGDCIVVEGRYTGTNTGPLQTPAGELPPTGRSLDMPFADVFRVVDGRIAEHRIYYDVGGMLTQLGLAPEPASA
jgi:ketosteroid isomerase-like protein